MPLDKINVFNRIVVRMSQTDLPRKGAILDSSCSVFRVIRRVSSKWIFSLLM